MGDDERSLVSSKKRSLQHQNAASRPAAWIPGVCRYAKGRIAALRAALDDALRERDLARDAAARATAATRGMAGDAGESLEALDARLDALELSAGARVSAAETAAAQRHAVGSGRCRNLTQHSTHQT